MLTCSDCCCLILPLDISVSWILLWWISFLNEYVAKKMNMATCSKCESEGGIVTKRCEECILKGKDGRIRAAPARSGSDPVTFLIKAKLNESGLFRAPALRPAIRNSYQKKVMKLEADPVR